MGFKKRGDVEKLVPLDEDEAVGIAAFKARTARYSLANLTDEEREEMGYTLDNGQTKENRTKDE